MIMFETWAGHRFLSEKVTPSRKRAGRPFKKSPPAAVSEEVRRVQKRVACQFLGILVRSLANSEGGLDRSVLCQFGAQGLALTSRPLESALPGALDLLRSLWGSPKRSVNLIWSMEGPQHSLSYKTFAERSLLWDLGCAHSIVRAYGFPRVTMGTS